MVSPAARPLAPVSARKKPSSRKLALRPPPRSSLPVMPQNEVDMPPLSIPIVLAAAPLGLVAAT